MKRWMTGILVALGGLLPTLAHAQDPWMSPGMQASGFQETLPPGMPLQPQRWSNSAQGGYCPPSANTYQQLVPGWGTYLDDHDDPGWLPLKEAFANSYLRVDYLLWDITGPSNVLLGAPNSSGADLSGKTPNNRLVAVDPVNGPRQLTSAIVPTLQQSYMQQSGIRGVIGVPTREGTLEAETWYIEKGRNNIQINPFLDNQIPPGQTLIGGMTLLNNGAVSSTTMILFSQSYQAAQQTALFGAEGNWIFNPFTANVPMEVSPILGFRYIRLQDTLHIFGDDIPDPTNAPTTVLHHDISSLARNNIFGPQIGLKFASTVFKRVDLGAETKFVIGINKMSESVRTQQIYSTAEAPQIHNDQPTRFSPFFDLSLYSKIHLTNNFHLYVGYDLLLGSGISRAYQNIYYNAPASVNDPPAITLQSSHDTFIAHGLAVGGELVFR